MTDTSIEWTEKTWNPVTGCSKVSPGCAHCYAETVALRFWPSQYPPVVIPLAERDADNECPVADPDCLSNDGDCHDGCEAPTRPRQFTDVLCHEDRLEQPLRWRKPRRVFVNSMSDLFHEDVPDAFIDRVFAVMALAPQHTFQVLTKRAERMRTYIQSRAGNVVGCFQESWNETQCEHLERVVDTSADKAFNMRHGITAPGPTGVPWPLPNAWLGVSVENQRFADERIPVLLQTPAAVRFLSCEPLFGHLNIAQFISDKYISVGGRQWIGAGGIGWVIVGCESGADRRNQDDYERHARAVLQQCESAGVARFHKQMPIRGRVSHDPAEWPEDLCVREFPAQP